MRTSAFYLTVSLSVLGVLAFATGGGCGSDNAGTTGRGGAGGTAGSGSGGSGGARTSISLTIASLGASSATGTALFEKLGSGEIKLTVMVSGVAPASAQHGIHIHANASCADASDGDGGTTIGGGAGGHWNPESHMHGTSPATNHLGDVGNIMVDASGAGMLTFMTTAWTIGTGAANDIVNHALVLHASPDDGATQPTGNAGGRIGCVVIQ
jgi:superoxide dismutase, Cu-Zn family